MKLNSDDTHIFVAYNGLQLTEGGDLTEKGT